MSAVPEQYLSLQEYFALEETSEIKHEYYQGIIFAMTGATARHNFILANIISSLRPQLRGKRCSISPSDLRVKVEATGLYTYPDASVYRGDLRFTDGRQDTVINPTVIIEVLSPSTENYDRGMKFHHFRSIESLQEYLLIAQDNVYVEHYARQDAHQWLLREFTQSDQVIELRSIGCTLALDTIYEEISFTKE